MALARQPNGPAPEADSGPAPDPPSPAPASPPAAPAEASPAAAEGEEAVPPGCAHAGQVLDVLTSGAVKVWWADGTTSDCYPQDLFRVRSGTYSG